MDYRCLSINDEGNLAIGGADAVMLAKDYGTPLYIMDEEDIRENCRTFINAAKEFYPGESGIAFAGKALSFTYLYRILESEGMMADVVSGGEICCALKGGMKPEKLIFHGNNKTDMEIMYALEMGVGRFVVDNREELLRLDMRAGQKGKSVEISLRIKPGVEAHTLHEFIKTGGNDSKFGFALETGEALEILREAAGLTNVKVTGLHCHIGSQILDTEPFAYTAGIMADFFYMIKKELRLPLEELNLGGGLGIRYTAEDIPLSVRDTIKAVSGVLVEKSKEASMPLPRLVFEPGRSIAGPSGITVYRVGSVKEIPEIRTYVSVDGSMADNPRYTMYGAEYDAVLAEKPQAPKTKKVTVAGRCCESDTLIKDILMPEDIKAGDYMAVLATGAYNYSMAGNYNRLPRPPVVMVSRGEAKLVVRRENYEDLLKCDVEE